MDAHGLAERYRPTLPRQITSLKLMNIAFRGRAVDVTISRLPSGQVVRKIEERSAND
jgi:hypothetical protein